MITYQIPSIEEESFDDVCKELKRISEILQELLPDPTLGPEERLERLARVAPQSCLKSEHSKTARTKLNNIRCRLYELVPSSKLSIDQRLNFLIQRIHTLVPEPTERFFHKLEKLGDERMSDNGR